MISEYTGKNEKGLLRKFIRTVTTTCPTTDCHETHLSVKTLQQDAGDDGESEGEESHHTAEQEISHDETTKREGIFKVVGNNKNDGGDTGIVKETSESYLEDALSELAKKQLVAGGGGGGGSGESDENVFCTSSGCYNTLKELQEIQLLAETINQLQSKLNDNSKVEQTLTRMREEISSDIKKTLGGEHSVIDGGGDDAVVGDTQTKPDDEKRTRPEL